MQMSTKTDAVTGAAIKHAIEGRDGRMLASFYADDASRRSARSGTTSAAAP
jgi:hypothetical protein